MSEIGEEENLFGLNEAEDAGFGSDDDGPRNDEAIEVPEPGSKPKDAAIKPKRVIKNPQPKLDAVRLCGPRGIGIIQKWLSSAPYKGKGHETEDLGLLLNKLQHWTHRLYPRLPFADAITQIEKLGTKKGVQVNVKKLRMDIYETPMEDDKEIVDDVIRSGDTEAEQRDVFDELLGENTQTDSLRDRIQRNTNSLMSSQTVVSEPPVVETTPVMTDEIKARIERNKQLAIERRKALLAAQATSNAGQKLGDSKNTEPDVIESTPADVRNLRQGFLSSLSQTTTKDLDFCDEIDSMEIDEVMNKMNNVESLNKMNRDNGDENYEGLKSYEKEKKTDELDKEDSMELTDTLVSSGEILNSTLKPTLDLTEDMEGNEVNGTSVDGDKDSECTRLQLSEEEEKSDCSKSIIAMETQQTNNDSLDLDNSEKMPS